MRAQPRTDSSSHAEHCLLASGRPRTRACGGNAAGRGRGGEVAALRRRRTAPAGTGSAALSVRGTAAQCRTAQCSGRAVLAAEELHAARQRWPDSPWGRGMSRRAVGAGTCSQCTQHEVLADAACAAQTCIKPIQLRSQQGSGRESRYGLHAALLSRKAEHPCWAVLQTSGLPPSLPLTAAAAKEEAGWAAAAAGAGWAAGWAARAGWVAGWAARAAPEAAAARGTK